VDINEIVGMLPEDKRETVKAELSAYVKLGSKDDAAALAANHPHIKSVVDSLISKAVQSHDERFQSEKLPGLVEAEILKRNPPKDPRDLKLVEMENKMRDMERAAIAKDQTARAVAKAAELGLPSDIAKRYIGNSDAETDAAIDMLAGALKPWRDTEVNRLVSERLGNNSAPRGGVAPNQLEQMRRDYIRLNNEGLAQEATALWLQMRSLEEKR
jgi:hypothetical protein